MRPSFPDEGASVLDSFLVRIGPQTSLRELELAWFAHDQQRGTKSFIDSWRRKDPTVAEAILRFALALPVSSGVAWVMTSDFRDSPSHKDGGAVDFAPRPSNWSRFAASRGLDPVLNGRNAIAAHLRRALANATPPKTRAITVFIEDDHAHLHLHKGGGLAVRFFPGRTHHQYKSHPNDHICRADPSKFKPRF